MCSTQEVEALDLVKNEIGFRGDVPTDVCFTLFCLFSVCFLKNRVPKRSPCFGECISTEIIRTAKTIGSLSSWARPDKSFEARDQKQIRFSLNKYTYNMM